MTATAVAPWSEADRVAAELREALGGLGIVLPSLGTDLSATLAGTPLIDLGRVNLETARALTEVFRRAAAEQSAEM